MKIIGIDLAGKSDNPTGICVLTVEKTTRVVLTFVHFILMKKF
jgi:predicted RNase H-like nuclease